MGRQLGGTGSHKFAFAGAIRVEGSISAVLKESLGAPIPPNTLFPTISGAQSEALCRLHSWTRACFTVDFLLRRTEFSSLRTTTRACDFFFFFFF